MAVQLADAMGDAQFAAEVARDMAAIVEVAHRGRPDAIRRLRQILENLPIKVEFNEAPSEGEPSKADTN